MISPKNLLLLLALLLFFSSSLVAQPCFPEGISFNSQDDIDNFQFNYPDCDEIEGDVFIGGYLNNISNLSGLEVIVSIGGNLEIEGAYSLTDLNGLENLTSVGGGLSLSLNNFLQDLSALSGLSFIGTYLSISGNQALTSLAGLENVELLESYLSIINNSTLISLFGLHTISSINGSVWIYQNESLNDLTGLSALELIGGDLTLTGNSLLGDCQGLENLSGIGGDLNLQFNPLMTNLDGFNSLSEVSGNLSIIGNTTLNDLMGLINLSSIGGDLKIGEIYGGTTGNPSLTSLDGLNNIDASSIQGLYILNNPLLSSCEVQSICNYLLEPGGIVEIQYNATGCNDFTEVEVTCSAISCLPDGIVFNSQSQIDNFPLDYPNCFEIMGDVQISGENISNLSGLNVLDGFWGNLVIENTILAEINGLENVVFIGGDFVISDNDLMSTLQGLSGLNAIDGELLITNNQNLLSLEGLDNIIEGSIELLTITNNPLLDECHVESICNFLSYPDYQAEIHDNDTSCSSVEVVLNECDWVGVKKELPPGGSFSLSPNPVRQRGFVIHHRFTAGQLSTAASSTGKQALILNINDIYGNVVLYKEVDFEENSSRVNVSGWSSGIYMVRLYAGNQVYLNSRIIIL